METTITNEFVFNSAAAYITRQDIVNFPFPYKLWLIVNLEFCDFLRWNRDGTVVLLDLVALDDYLNATRSIFKIKNRSVFLQHLEEFKFERLNATPEADEDILLQYKNESFQRHRMDLLAKVRRYSYELIGDNSKSETGCDVVQNSPNLKQSANSSINSRAADRMLGDLCFMFHGSLSNIQRSRLRFQTIFNFQNETRILREKLKASDEMAARNRRTRVEGSARSSVADDDQVIEVPMDLFENPHDSVLNLGDDFRPEYAGYYGSCSKETIINFFGEYLPMYEDGTTEIRKIIADNSTSNNKDNLASGWQTVSTMQPSYSIQIDTNAIVSSTSGEFQTIADLQYSSALEPIFKTEVEQDALFETNTESFNSTQINPNNNDLDTEISMEEFLKFKDPLALDNSVEEQSDAEEFKTVDGIYKEPNVACSSQSNSAELFPQIPLEFKNFNEICEGSNVACSSKSSNAERFPQMPLDVKTEIEEDKSVENEANFRNFFSQYRASLNLLYERH